MNEQIDLTNKGTEVLKKGESFDDLTAKIFYLELVKDSLDKEKSNLDMSQKDILKPVIDSFKNTEVAGDFSLEAILQLDEDKLANLEVKDKEAIDRIKKFQEAYQSAQESYNDKSDLIAQLKSKFGINGAEGDLAALIEEKIKDMQNERWITGFESGKQEQVIEEIVKEYDIDFSKAAQGKLDEQSIGEAYSMYSDKSAFKDQIEKIPVLSQSKESLGGVYGKFLQNRYFADEKYTGIGNDASKKLYEKMAEEKVADFARFTALQRTYEEKLETGGWDSVDDVEKSIDFNQKIQGLASGVVSSLSDSGAKRIEVKFRDGDYIFDDLDKIDQVKKGEELATELKTKKQAVDRVQKSLALHSRGVKRPGFFSRKSGKEWDDTLVNRESELATAQEELATAQEDFDKYEAPTGTTILKNRLGDIFKDGGFRRFVDYKKSNPATSLEFKTSNDAPVYFEMDLYREYPGSDLINKFQALEDEAGLKLEEMKKDKKALEKMRQELDELKDVNLGIT